MTGNPITWLHFHARNMGMQYDDYRLLTMGEIEDMAICKAIQSGNMDEVPIFEGSYLPDLD